MAQPKFGASEFCRLTGISAETLRHYAECGIIDAVEVASNNYKKYSARNAIDVFHARMCRGLDMAVPHIIHKADFALEEQESLLREHEAALQAEALALDFKIGRLRQQIDFMSFVRENLGKVKERSADEVPSLYRLMLIGDHISNPAEAQRITDQWMSYPQYTHVAIRAPLAALADRSVDELPMQIGIGIREEYAVMQKLDTRPPAEHFPRARNIGTVVATFDPLCLRRSDIQMLFDKVDELGCRITSDLVGRLATSIETDRGRLYYFTVSFCIK